MAIEVPVRKEIATFESRPAFGLTARQLKTLGIALPVGLGMFALFSALIDFNAGTNAAILTVVPIFAVGLFKKNEYYIEKYIPIIWAHRYKPQKRLYKTENAVLEYMTPEDRDKDISRLLLHSRLGKTTASAEANLQFQPNPKTDKQIIKEAYKMCRISGRAHRADLRKRARAAAREARATERLQRKIGRKTLDSNSATPPPIAHERQQGTIYETDFYYQERTILPEIPELPEAYIEPSHYQDKNRLPELQDDKLIVRLQRAARRQAKKAAKSSPIPPSTAQHSAQANPRLRSFQARRLEITDFMTRLPNQFKNTFTRKPPKGG